ncbi:hypothetical protein FQA39_LY12846 [Lamprigera yunnana]|nr:hypothetical protein FQA39_LY12846 [Lamprigera yunnana]
MELLKGRRSEEEEIVKSRLDKALLEIPLKYNYNYVVENDTVENAVAKITDILKLEAENSNEEEMKKAKEFDAEKHLTNILTDKVYRKILGHGDFKKILDKDFIDFKIQKLMFQLISLVLIKNQVNNYDELS